MIQKVFNRYEKKYMLTAEEYKILRKRLDEYMLEDAYGIHTIRNIYYDTDTDELIRTSLEKPRYKEKFRVRCYGQPTSESEIFLEIKKKYKGLVNKRRVVLKPQETKAYLEEGKHPANDSQIMREIDYFLMHYQLKPKVYLAYDRVALFGKEDKNFRVTFDTNIRSRNFDLRLENDENTTTILGNDYYLMEVKISDSIPLWFVHILDEMNIRTISFSKYGTVYKTNLVNGCYDYIGQVRVPVNFKNNYVDARRICTC